MHAKTLALSTAVTVIVMLAAVGFAAIRSERHAADRAEPSAGEQLFAQHCAGCHTVEAVASVLRSGSGAASERAAAMVQFLKTHGGSSDAEDRDIVAFVQSRSAER